MLILGLFLKSFFTRENLPEIYEHIVAGDGKYACFIINKIENCTYILARTNNNSSKCIHTNIVHSSGRHHALCIVAHGNTLSSGHTQIGNIM